MSGIELTIIDAGLMDYGRAWDLQHVCQRLCVSGQSPGFLILVEHPAVITLGKNASEEFLLASRSWLKKAGVDVFRSDRGGEATAHNPGQLVVYPVIALAGFRLGARAYVERLENAVISTLKRNGIQSRQDAAYPGVWVGAEKVCAVGARVKERVTMHGIAINVENDLEIFNWIVPCGIAGRGVTSVARLTGGRVGMDSIKQQFLKEFGRLFECELTAGSIPGFGNQMSESTRDLPGDARSPIIVE